MGGGDYGVEVKFQIKMKGMIKIPDGIALEDRRRLDFVLRRRLSPCHKCGVWRHIKKKCCPKMVSEENGGDADTKENVEVAPTREPVVESSKETNAEGERRAVEDGEARAKASTKDSTASDEATDIISPKAK